MNEKIMKFPACINQGVPISAWTKTVFFANICVSNKGGQ